jgi:methylenetetrahydrofolate dehydrogenase (NADP+)/methenyltetrahydrofolate cyclohydrolase
MPATILDGKQLAQQLRSELAEEVIEFIQNNSVVPCLAAVLVGDNPASEVYVRNKRRACEAVGIESQLHRLSGDATSDDILKLIAKLNKDAEVHGILIQLPLPPQIDKNRVLSAVSPNKDVDAFHPDNVGRLVQGRPRFLPCTPQGVQQLLIRNGIETAGQHVVVLGRSEIVGRPLSIMLSQHGKGGDATVTICHSRSHNLPAITRQADILVVAVGRAKFVMADMVKPGAVVIDVGINRAESGVVGDVDYEAVATVAGAITPVPGGVGPLTIAMLLRNTLLAAQSLET